MEKWHCKKYKIEKGKKDMKLLIPSAKVVPEELQNLGKLPAVIYPINGHTVFSYIYQQYSHLCNMVVLCYENSYKIHKKLIKYCDITIFEIPELIDLAHTIYYGITSNEPIIINFGDTIVLDIITENKPDCFYYVEDYVSSKWTYFENQNGVLTDIYDKRSVSSSNKGKMFVGVFYISDSQCFKECLEKAFNGTDKSMSSFYQALSLYSKIHPLNPIKTSRWFDIGHADKYFDSKIGVQAREFNHIDIDKNRGVLTKHSDDKDKFIGEIKWYLKLPSDIEYIRPRIFKYSLDYNNPYVSMEYYTYHTLHELFLNGDLDIYQWKQIFEKIRFIYHDLKRYKVSDKNIMPSIEDMYLTKTIHRLDKLRQDTRFCSFFSKPIFVNGVKYCSLDSVVKILKITIPDLLYNINEFNIIHGDLCFANMLIDNNFFFIKLIDPRGKFGVFDIYGDSRYELAKLLHSVDGKYDYIVKDLFTLEYKGEKINYAFWDMDSKCDLYSVFVDVFQDEIGADLKRIELIEALLFLSMIPLHRENFNHQLVMLAKGLEVLSRVVDIEVHDND